MGLLLASLLVLPAELGWLRRNLRRHVALLVAFAALTAFAISHRVFVGPWLLFELPMPHLLHLVLGSLRSSGRFFWPIVYAQMAMVIVLGFRRGQPVIVLCLAGTAILQLYDVQPLRARIIASISTGPHAEALDRGQVARLVAGAHHVEVVPSVDCTEVDSEKGRANMTANIEVLLATARANVPTNTVYRGRSAYGVTLLDALRAPSRFEQMREARRDAFCRQEIARARGGGPPGNVFVLLSDQPRQEEMAPGIKCSPLSSWARYCERSPE